jgi:hypothetical protein
MTFIMLVVFKASKMSAAKRKAVLPQKVGDAKRRELSWNMLDMLQVQGQLLISNEEESDVSNSCETSMPGKQPTNSEYSIEEEPDMNIDENLKHMIDKCDFSVKIVCKSADVNSSMWSGRIGRFVLKLLDAEKSVTAILSYLLEHVTEARLYIDMLGAGHFIYIDLSFVETLPVIREDEAGLVHQEVSRSDKAMYFPVSVNVPVDCLYGFQSKKEFVLQFSSCCVEAGTLQIDVFVLEPALVVLDHPSQWLKPRRCHMAIQKFACFFYGLEELGEC